MGTLREAVSGLGEVQKGVEQARTDKINHDAEVDKKLDWLHNRLQGDEQNGKMRPPPSNSAPF